MRAKARRETKSKIGNRHSKISRRSRDTGL
jgi:hypothetical protein